jgi:DNA-nicking Smr family endonuclease
MKKDNGINEILEYLELHGVTDKDSDAHHASSAKKEKKSKPAGKRHTLDLHGLTVLEASRSLKITLIDCHQRGVKEILVIHGKGYHSKSESGPVLKGLVNQMLENELHHIVRSFASAKLKDGGAGATVVLLK